MRHSLSLQLFRLDLSGTPQLHLNIWVLKTGRARRSLAGEVVGAGSWRLLLHLIRCPWCPRVQGYVLLTAPLLLEKSRVADHGWRLSMAPECLSAAIPTEGCELPRAQPGCSPATPSSSVGLYNTSLSVQLHYLFVKCCHDNEVELL